MVEKANHTAAQRWWRTLPDDVTVEQTQHGLGEFCRQRADARLRATATGKVTVATLAATEPLATLPGSPYPLILSQNRTVSRQAMVAYRGNRYSVPPELASATVSVTHVLGSTVIDIVTSSQITIARHRLAADGAGVMVRGHDHVAALDHVQADGTSMTAVLEEVLSIEVHATEARRLAGRLRFACLPTPASADDFDYDAGPRTGPQTHRRTGHLPLPGDRDQTFSSSDHQV